MSMNFRAWQNYIGWWVKALWLHLPVEVLVLHVTAAKELLPDQTDSTGYLNFYARGEVPGPSVREVSKQTYWSLSAQECNLASLVARVRQRNLPQVSKTILVNLCKIAEYIILLKDAIIIVKDCCHKWVYLVFNNELRFVACNKNIFHMNENAKGFSAEHLLKLSLLFWYCAALYGIKCIAVYSHITLKQRFPGQCHETLFCYSEL